MIPSLEFRKESVRAGRRGRAFFAEFGGYSGSANATVDGYTDGYWNGDEWVEDPGSWVHAGVTGSLEGSFVHVGGERYVIAGPCGTSEYGMSFALTILPRQTFGWTLGGTQYQRTASGGGVGLGFFARPRLSPNVRILLEANGYVGLQYGTIADTGVAIEWCGASGARFQLGFRRLCVSTRGQKLGEEPGMPFVASGRTVYDVRMDFDVSGPTAGLTFVF